MQGSQPVPGYTITKFKVNDPEGPLDNSGITPEAGKWHQITINVAAEDKGFTIDANGTLSGLYRRGLEGMVSHVNQGNWNTNCTLTANIELTGEKNWTPVDINVYPYPGTFDGAGHTISGMNVSGNFGQGFIGYLSSTGTVKNLTISKASVSGINTIDGLWGTLK